MDDKTETLKGKLQRLYVETAESIVCRHLAKKTWECFLDESYYGMWAVREAGEKRWGHAFHLPNKEEAEGLCALLNQFQEAKHVDKPEDKPCPSS